MPCYSKIKTVLINLETIRTAAAQVGVAITEIDADTYRLSKNGEQIVIWRAGSGQNFYANDFSDDFRVVLTPLIKAYAKTEIKTWAQKNGYQFSSGKKPGEYIMTQYK